MGKVQKIELDYVVSYCQDISDTHKMLAAKEQLGAFASVKDQKKRDEYLAKAQIADSIADHFRTQSGGNPTQNPEIDRLAREIAPEVFASYDAMVHRMLAKGNDEGYARHAAQAIYGDGISTALEKASESIAVDSSDDYDSYSRGLSDAINWHEAQAREADLLERNEPVATKKARYAKRAARHRLYAKYMRQDLLEKRAMEQSKARTASPSASPAIELQPGRDLGEEGIPIEVQMRFRKKSESFDDEGGF